MKAHLKPGRSGDDFRSLVRGLMLAANQGFPLASFLDCVTARFLGALGNGGVAIHLEGWAPSIRYHARRGHSTPFRFETERRADPPGVDGYDSTPPSILWKALCEDIPSGLEDHVTPRGTFWTPDIGRMKPIDLGAAGPVELAAWGVRESFRSLILVPLRVEGRRLGLLQLTCDPDTTFSIVDVRFFEDAAEVLGLVLTHQQVQSLAQERVKELTCLYGIAKVAESTDLDLAARLRAIAELLPPGWQYPDVCEARIAFDGAAHATAGFRKTAWIQSAPILVGGRPRGRVEIVYTEPRPELVEGPFLAEERNLIDEVARGIGLIVERTQAEEEKARLHEQLLHADRLATIGKLAAGIAHELSEPLGAILGFAQLAGTVPDLPPQTRQDLEKIVQASLRAREIIKKLLFFGRQTPPARAPIDLNRVVRDGLTILEPRFDAARIQLTLELAAELPTLIADPGQIAQVVVNLVLNSIQAMPAGGTIVVSTSAEGDRVCLTVADTGIGMPKEILAQIFEPFFSTKEVGQGTGLGLAVVHGIVSSHGGSIEVTSEPGRGSRFEVRLPVHRGVG